MSSPRSPRSTDVAVAVAVAALFAGSFAAARIATASLTPLSASLLRYGIALVFLSALAIRGGGLQIAPRDAPAMAGLGLAGIAGYNALFFAALGHTATTNTAILNAFSPVLTGALAALVLRERLGRRRWLGLGVSVSGVLVLVGGAGPAALNLGDGLMLGAVACWAIYAVGARRLLDRYGGLAVTWHATAWGVAWLGLLAAREGPLVQLAAAPRAAWWALVYMGVGASGIGYLLYNRSIAALGPTLTAGTVYGLVPPMVAALSWGWLGEPLTGQMAAGAALVLPGLWLALRR